MTALRRFEPTPDYHHFLVVLAADRYYKDMGKLTRHVRAIGPNGARQLALEQMREQYPDACYLRVELEDAAFCDDCGFRLDIHWDKTGPNRPDWKLPYGCPPNEKAAEMEWGR